jgi:hypothetical protein
MNKLKLFVNLTILTVGVFMLPALSCGQQSWQTALGHRFAEVVLGIQKICIQQGKVECELLEIEQNPPLLLQGQVIDYIGVRQREVPYFYLVVAERDDMIPEIYLFDSQNRLLSSGTGLRGGNLAVHKPEYTQKVFERIRMLKGSGHIGVAILAPVGSY